MLCIQTINHFTFTSFHLHNTKLGEADVCTDKPVSKKLGFARILFLALHSRGPPVVVESLVEIRALLAIARGFPAGK